jgi:hypothetical protein
MSEKTCAVCNKVLSDREIRINERSLRLGGRKARFLCLSCRQKEYESYQNSLKKLINKD